MSTEFQKLLETLTFPAYLTVKILPGSSKTEVIERMSDGETWKIRVAAPPEKGKANTELVRFLKKSFGLQTEVVSGKTDRRKLLKINMGDK